MNNTFKEAYKKGGKCKIETVKSIMFRQLSSRIEHKSALASTQDSFHNAVKFAFPKVNHFMCVYTDTSKEF